MRRLLAAFFTFLIPTLSAYTAPCPGEIGVSAEWLYMLSFYDQPFFVIDSNSMGDPIGPRVSNNQEWHSGYRLEGVYAFCCRPSNDVRLRWTHFPSFSESKSVSGEDLFGILNVPVVPLNSETGTMELRDEFDFHFLDALFSQQVFACGPFQMSLLGGVQYGYLDWYERCLFDDSGASVPVPRLVEIESELWGIGPEIGYDFSYCLWGGLTLTGRGNVTLLVSERKASYFDQDGVMIEASTSNDSYWSMIPTTDLRFGLSYARCFCDCLTVDLEVGYEIISYFNGLDRIYYVDNLNDGSSLDELMNFTLQGFYLHLGAKF